MLATSSVSRVASPSAARLAPRARLQRRPISAAAASTVTSRGRAETCKTFFQVARAGGRSRDALVVAAAEGPSGSGGDGDGNKKDETAMSGLARRLVNRRYNPQNAKAVLETFDKLGEDGLTGAAVPNSSSAFPDQLSTHRYHQGQHAMRPRHTYLHRACVKRALKREGVELFLHPDARHQGRGAAFKVLRRGVLASARRAGCPDRHRGRLRVGRGRTGRPS